MAKQVVTALRMTPVLEAVTIPFVGELINDECAVVASPTMEEAATAMLGELVRMEAALRTVRAD